MYIKDKKEKVCGKDKTIYTLNGEKFIKQIGKKGDVYVSLEKYIKKKKDKGECLNPIVDKRLQILNKIFKKSSSVKHVVNRSSSRRRASSSRRRAIAANKNMVLDITNSSSYKLSNRLVRSPLIVQPARRFTLSNSKKSKDGVSLGKKTCKKDCVKDGKICNFSSGRCVKPKKEKNVIVKKVPLEKIGTRPCKQDCTSINKICKISSRRCVNPPKKKPIINGQNIKPCKKDCALESKICNFASGRCIKQKN